MNRRGFLARLFGAGVVAAVAPQLKPKADPWAPVTLPPHPEFKFKVACLKCNDTHRVPHRQAFRTVAFDDFDHLGRGGFESYTLVPCPACRSLEYGTQMRAFARMERRQDYERKRRRFRAERRDPARLPL